MVFCSACGSENPDGVNKCSKCGKALFKKNYLSINRFDTFEELFSDKNLQKLENHFFTPKEYELVIENIRQMGEYNLGKIQENSGISFKSPLSKIAAIAAAYASVNYKSRGAELGSYSFNLINIDDRLDQANQIATLIHELSHHLVSEIFEQILMFVWEVEKTDALESFVFFALTSNPGPMLMDEYCAHSVEGRFIPHGYQNYGSFNKILETKFDMEKDMEIIVSCSIFGNTLAKDITELLESFISDDLREAIKKQYKRDYPFPPQYDQILLERKEIWGCEDLIESIFENLKVAFKLAREDDTLEILNTFKKNYSIVNQKQKTYD